MKSIRAAMASPEPSRSIIMSSMTAKDLKSILPDEPFQVFVCYAHADNESEKREQRWLDRLLEFLSPLERQALISSWSDRKLLIGESWHENIQARLDRSKAVILLVSPAFLSSKYVSTNELPVILARAKERSVPIIPILLSPSLFERVTYKYPDPQDGPNSFSLASLQTANPPSKTLSEMTEAQQNRIFQKVTDRLLGVLQPSPTASQVETSLEKPTAKSPAILLAQFQENNGVLRKEGKRKTPQYWINMWIEQAPRETKNVTFEIDDLSFGEERIWSQTRGRGAREYFSDDMNSYGDVDIWVRGKLKNGDDWRIKSSLYGALKRYYGDGEQRVAISKALEQIRKN